MSGEVVKTLRHNHYNYLLLLVLLMLLVTAVAMAAHLDDTLVRSILRGLLPGAGMQTTRCTMRWFWRNAPRWQPGAR